MNVDITAPVHPESPVTMYDLAQIGSTVLNWVVTIHRLGHANPNSTLDYAWTLNTGPALFVRDFVAWAANHQSISPGCVERIQTYLETIRWEDVLVAGLDDLLAGRARP